MKKPPFILAALLTVAAPFHLSAATVYWDSNGAILGAGGATPNGIWGTDAFWSADMTGASSTVGWVPGDTAVFAAGSDAINAYTVTLGAAQTAGGLIVEEGTVSLAGSALTIGVGTVRIDSGAKL